MDRLEQIKQRIRIMEPRGGLPGGWEDDLYWLVKQATVLDYQRTSLEEELEQLRDENTRLKDAIDWVCSVCAGTPKRPFTTILERLSPLLREAPPK